MVTLPTPQTYWRAAGAADDAWTLDADSTFTPAAGQAVEVVTVGPSPIARAVADTIPAISGLADLNATYASAITINAALSATGTNLVYSLTGPAWLSINPATGQITGTAPSETVSDAATVTVRNAAGAASDTFAVVVSNGTPVTLPQVSSLVGFGDSITVGALIDDTNDKWLHRVSAVINSGTRVNAGINGTVLQNSPDSTGSPRANNGRNRFVSTLTGANKREMAVIAYGFNDARYVGATATFNVTEYENDYNEVIAGLRIAGYPADRLVIVSPYWIANSGLSTGSAGFSGQTRAGFEAFVAAARRVAEANGCWYHDAYAWMRDNGGVSLISGDAIHPNVTGHAVIAEGVLYHSARLNTIEVPGSITATGGSEQITVSWAAVSGASGYEVALATEGSFAFGAPQAASGTSTTITGLAPGSLRARVRAIVGGVAGPWAYATSAATITTSASVPAAFAEANWSVSTGATAGAITLNILALPASGGSAINGIDYSTDDGASWIPLSGAGTGARTLAMPSPGTAYNFVLRARNVVGAGPASTAKTATSGVAPAGLSADFGIETITVNSFGSVPTPAVSFGVETITITS